MMTQVEGAMVRGWSFSGLSPLDLGDRVGSWFDSSVTPDVSMSCGS